MTHKEIVMKLIGQVRPVCETNEDDRRFTNLTELCNLVDDLVTEIDKVYFDFKDYQEHSAKRASEYAKNFITKTLGIV